MNWGDVTLTDDAARSSPQVKLAMDFFGALRATDKDAIARLATAEQIARIQQETQQPSGQIVATQRVGLLPAMLPLVWVVLSRRPRTHVLDTPFTIKGIK